MDNPHSLLGMVLGASVLVQLVLLLLLVASVLSWAVILRKRRQFRQVRQAADFFDKRFWSGPGLEQLYQSLDDTVLQPGSVEEVFLAGYRGFRHIYEQPPVRVAVALESAQRGMKAALNRTLDTLEQDLAVLATIGSTAPYVGLFGTVWGIMSAFQGLSQVKQATLAMVAPGIAEALVATAMGLVAAIPAVIAYNRFSQQVAAQASRYESFVEDFMALLERQADQVGDAAPPGEATAPTASSVEGT